MKPNTTMQMTISVADGNISVTGPFSEYNITTWRSLGGKFAGGAWLLPDNDTVRSLIAEMFGEKSEEMDALVPYDKIPRSYGDTAQLGGYVLAQRRGRDRPVQMPDGVALAAGSFRASGGSVKSPQVALDGGVVFRLRCRRSFAEANGLEIATSPASAIDI